MTSRSPCVRRADQSVCVVQTRNENVLISCITEHDAEYKHFDGTRLNEEHRIND
jgi:hypothetical protein